MRRMYSLNQLEEVAREQAKLVKKDISTLVDEDGYNRFIGGDIDLVDNAVPTKIYAKWSLSGTHLLIVVCCSANNGDVVSAGTLTKNIDLPQWVIDKITPLGNTVVSREVTNWYGSDNSTQQGVAILEKNVLGKITIYMNSITLNADRNSRIAFDLLIDNE